jgi:VIT1/CCC1 family predicted Fe2+/Mn2+ transporter
MHAEINTLGEIGWLRAAVMGANDGIVSTASLTLGVASATESSSGVLIAGIAGLVAGALSMATGEYVSVSSQADAENAALALEASELKANYAEEVKELGELYVARGLDPVLANEVARQLMEHDALGAHAKDELGLTEVNASNPFQAAFSSALSFCAGGIVPLVVASVASRDHLISSIFFSTLFSLVALGGSASLVGKASARQAILRTVCWSSVAMLVSVGVGRFCGTLLG